jgi:deoxyribodipyrimidine photolyase
MRASEIIRDILNFIDQVDTKTVYHDDPVEQAYANAPHEVTQPIATIIAQGTDMNHPKHPSDIRTNAPSMYPNFQAKE